MPTTFWVHCMFSLIGLWKKLCLVKKCWGTEVLSMSHRKTQKSDTASIVFAIANAGMSYPVFYRNTKDCLLNQSLRKQSEKERDGQKVLKALKMRWGNNCSFAYQMTWCRSHTPHVLTSSRKQTDGVSGFIQVTGTVAPPIHFLRLIKIKDDRFPFSL